jgi:hypothetical protein
MNAQELATALQLAYDSGGPHAAAKLIVENDHADEVVLAALSLLRRRTVADEIVNAARQRQTAAAPTGSMQNRVT